MLVGIPSLEIIVQRLPVPVAAAITDWGQSASLVLALTGVLHRLYVMCTNEDFDFGKLVRKKTTPVVTSASQKQADKASLERHSHGKQSWLARQLCPLDFPRSGLPTYSHEECMEMLQEGVKRGTIPLIRSAFKNGADVNGKFDGLHMVRWMMEQRGESDEDLEILTEILVQHPDIALWDKDHFTALTWAVWRKTARTVQLLLREKQDFNTSNNVGIRGPQDNYNIAASHDMEGRSALQVATLEGKADIVELLLDAGAQPHHDDLCWAVQRGRQNVVRLLLDGGRQHRFLLLSFRPPAPSNRTLQTRSSTDTGGPKSECERRLGTLSWQSTVLCSSRESLRCRN